MTEDDAFSPDDFDPWAETYDRDTATQSRFPFAGYEQALDMVVDLAAPVASMSILDIGTGTGNLALRFAEHGCAVWCSDFSEAMLEKARRKLPRAHFVLHDLRHPWPAELERSFDRIVSAYVFHHFEVREKIELCRALIAQRLTTGGRLVIADISFPSEDAMTAFARSVGNLWEVEPYWLADESIAALTEASLKVTYTQVSECAGVYAITSASPARYAGTRDRP